MSIEKQDVTHVARLARLAVSDEQSEELATELSNILEIIATLEQADVEGVAPLTNPLDMTQRLRPDHVNEDDQRTLLMQNAPQQTDGFFLVPRVID